MAKKKRKPKKGTAGYYMKKGGCLTTQLKKMGPLRKKR